MKLYSTSRGIAKAISDDMIEILDVPQPDLGALLAGPGLDALTNAAVLETIALVDAQLMAPIPRPGKVVFIGLNYPSHAVEVAADAEHSRPIADPKRPSFFIAPSSAVIGPGGTILRPRRAPKDLDYEGELAVVIGRTATDIDVDHAHDHDHIAGYTVANDVSSRDLQLRAMRGVGIDIAIAKSFDTFKPLGPCLQTADAINADDVAIRTMVNGELRQNARTSECYFSVGELVSYVSSYLTLDPGDVICTGSPAGSGMFSQRRFLEDGDVVSIEIEGIGTLTNSVGS